MKAKYLICSVVLAVFTGLAVYAQGYTGPGPAPITIEEAKKLKDDAPVVLRGKIEQYLGDEKYLFSDATGTIVVEIEVRLWADLTAGPDDVVEISGEVEKDHKGVEIEVKRIKKA
jgi:uncharacterized protein (TIGR00156 family)